MSSVLSLRNLCLWTLSSLAVEVTPQQLPTAIEEEVADMQEDVMVGAIKRANIPLLQHLHSYYGLKIPYNIFKYGTLDVITTFSGHVSRGLSLYRLYRYHRMDIDGLEDEPQWRISDMNCLDIQWAFCGACRSGRADVVQACLSRGITVRSIYPYDPVHLAYMSASAKTVQLLLEAGWTKPDMAFWWACQSGHVSWAQSQAEWLTHPHIHLQPTLIRALKKKHMAMFNYLYELFTAVCGPVLGLAQADYINVAATACRYGHSDVFVTMVTAVSTMVPLDELYVQAYVHALDGGHIDIANMLMQAGVDDLTVTLKVASRRGYRGIVDMCLDRIEDVHVRNEGLKEAVMGGYVDIVQAYVSRDICVHVDHDIIKTLYKSGRYGMLSYIRSLKTCTHAVEDYARTHLKTHLRHGHMVGVPYLRWLSGVKA